MRMKAAGRLALLIAAAAIAGCHKAEPVSPETVERIVDLSPHSVYRAFSSAVPKSGVQLVDQIRLPNGEITSLTVGIAKVADRSIEISAETPTMRLFHIRMDFLPLAHGEATHVRAVIEVDPTMVTKSADMSPRASMDMLKTALNRALDTVAAGRPLKPLVGGRIAEIDAAIRSNTAAAQPYRYGDPRPSEVTLSRRTDPDGPETIPMRNGRVVPMTSAGPMVSPNAVARRHSFSGD
jgi:hypothetical protein